MRSRSSRLFLQEATGRVEIRGLHLFATAENTGNLPQGFRSFMYPLQDFGLRTLVVERIAYSQAKVIHEKNTRFGFLRGSYAQDGDLAHARTLGFKEVFRNRSGMGGGHSGGII